MPRKNEEERKAYQAELMRKKRAAAKLKGEGNAENKNEEKANHSETVKPIPVQNTAPPEKTDLGRGASKELRAAPAPPQPVKAPPRVSPALVEEYTWEQKQAAWGVAARTDETLKKKGWIVWYSARLNSRIIIINDIEVRGFPQGYAAYTLKELGAVAKMEFGTLERIHALKMAGLQGRFPEMIEIEPENDNAL